MLVIYFFILLQPEATTALKNLSQLKLVAKQLTVDQAILASKYRIPI